MPSSKYRAKKRRQQQEAEEGSHIRVMSGHHIHTHELHGFDQVTHLRRRFRTALGYVPREP